MIYMHFQDARKSSIIKIFREGMPLGEMENILRSEFESDVRRLKICRTLPRLYIEKTSLKKNMFQKILMPLTGS